MHTAFAWSKSSNLMHWFLLRKIPEASMKDLVRQVIWTQLPVSDFSWDLDCILQLTYCSHAWTKRYEFQWDCLKYIVEHDALVLWWETNQSLYDRPGVLSNQYSAPQVWLLSPRKHTAFDLLSGLLFLRQHGDAQWERALQDLVWRDSEHLE